MNPLLWHVLICFAEFGEKEGTPEQLQQLQQRCPFKIYIYPLPLVYNEKVVEALARTSEKDRIPWTVLNLSQVTGKTPAPIFDWRSTMLDFTDEIIIHRNLARSNCVTADPSQASFFFLPVYSFYMYWLGMDGPRAELDRLLLLGDTGMLTTNGIDARWWERKGGCDHIIVASRPQAGWENGVISHMCGIKPIILGKEMGNVNPLPFLENHVSNVTQVQMLLKEEQGCLNKNVVLPYPVRYPRMRSGPKVKTSAGRRPLLASFVGSSNPSRVRRGLFEALEEASDCAVYNPMDRCNITETMDMAATFYENSTFAPVVVGDSRTSARAYCAIAMGAIPVFINFQVTSSNFRIVEDRRPVAERMMGEHPELVGEEGETISQYFPVELAFSNSLNWDTFSVQLLVHVEKRGKQTITVTARTKPVVRKQDYEAALVLLRNISDERVLSMQRELLKTRESFLYDYDAPTEGSAFDMLTKELGHRLHYAETCNRQPH
jgi:hypothetical protein